MAPKLFVIKFDKHGAIYMPGENITGSVIIDLEESKSCRDFKIAFKGWAHVYWTEQNGKTSTTYSETERYFDFLQPLIHKPPDKEQLELPAGRSQYNFTFQLPTDIPCSFEHTTGYIRYTVKAIVDIPWKCDWTTKSAFTVITPFDLNTIAHQCVPIDDETVKHYSCCFSDRGSIYVRVKIPSTGYVSGQTIDVDLKFDAKSSKVQVRKVSVKLEEVISFYAEGKTKTEKITLQHARTTGSLRRSEHVLLKLYIPPVPPSNLLPCDIIKLEYSVIANVHVNGLYRMIQRMHPILIGTIPLRYSMQSQRPTGEETGPSTSTGLSNSKVAPWPSSGDGSTQLTGCTMLPPSYQECLQKATYIKDSDDSHDVFGADEPFAPRYPVFNLSSPSPSAQ